MTWYAVYRIADGALLSTTSVLPVGLDPALAYVVVAQQPDATHAWDPVALTLVAVTPRPDISFGTFHQELTASGWTWYFLIGPVALQAAASTSAQTAQPTAAAAKTYVAANATDAQLHAALDWLITYRDRLASALSAAGVVDPTTNARYQKANTLVGVLGGML